MQNKHQFFLYGCPNLWGGGSSRLGQNPKFGRNFFLMTSLMGSNELCLTLLFSLSNHNFTFTLISSHLSIPLKPLDCLSENRVGNGQPQSHCFAVAWVEKLMLSGGKECYNIYTRIQFHDPTMLS